MTRFLKWKPGTFPVQCTKIIKYYHYEIKYGDNTVSCILTTCTGAYKCFLFYSSLSLNYILLLYKNHTLSCVALLTCFSFSFPHSSSFSSFYPFTSLLHIFLLWLVYSSNFSYSLSFALFLLSPSLFLLSVNNAPLLKQIHIIKYCISYHRVTFKSTATPITLYVTVK